MDNVKTVYRPTNTVCGGGGGGGYKTIKNVNKTFHKNYFQNFTNYSIYHPLSPDTIFKFLALIFFEVWHLQNFISIFSMGPNLTRGINSKKYVSAIFP